MKTTRLKQLMEAPEAPPQDVQPDGADPAVEDILLAELRSHRKRLNHWLALLNEEARRERNRSLRRCRPSVR
jgi:hypothetical protein